MKEEIISIIAFNLDIEPEEISTDDELENNLDMDDLDLAELILSLEEEYGIFIPEEDSAKFVTVNDVINYIEEKKK